MYEESPAAYEVLHAARGKDYRREAAEVVARVRSHRPEAGSVLDVACGTGLHLVALTELGVHVEGVELSEQMLAVARERLPDVPLHQGDMRSFRLGRRFDAVVCLFSSIGYMATLEDLAVATATMGEHLVEGGVLVVEPWFTPDQWHDGAVFSEAATSDGLAVARVSRSWTEGAQSLIEMHYVLATSDRTWAFPEIHRMGLFTTDQQLDVFRAGGFDVSYDHPGLTDRGLFVAVKRAPKRPPADAGGRVDGAAVST